MDLFRNSCLDDPLDVLVLVNEPTFPGCVMEVKPIGVFHMADDKGQDEKSNLCISDPIWNSLNDLSDMNPHLLKEIEHFFQVYKDLENKVDVGGWGDVNEAYEIKKMYRTFYQIENNLLDYSVLSNKYPVFYKKSNILLRLLLFC
jgi:inorganic pyrophosphatase